MNRISNKLDGRVALITGGSSGIGLATAQRFVAEGAYVFIMGRRHQSLDYALKKIDGQKVTAIQGDVSSVATQTRRAGAPTAHRIDGGIGVGSPKDRGRRRQLV